MKVWGFAGPVTDVHVSDQAAETMGVIAGRPAVWDTDPASGAESFAAFSLSPAHSVQLIGLNVDVDQLRRYAAELAPVSEAEWISAHHVVLSE